MVVFDLDDTLFRTAFRTTQILHEWAGDPTGKPFASGLNRLTADEVSYTLDPVLTRLGVPQSVWPAANQFWAERFFTSEYLKLDRPYPGAVAYVRAVQQAGAQVVYLTGRWGEMRPGTEHSLQDNGFPWDEGRSTRLLTKPDKATKDIDFKVTALNTLAAQGTIVASIDNEPRNVNTMHQLLPTAITVFLDKPHSPTAPPVDAGIEQVKDFPVVPGIMRSNGRQVLPVGASLGHR